METQPMHSDNSEDNKPETETIDISDRELLNPADSDVSLLADEGISTKVGDSINSRKYKTKITICLSWIVIVSLIALGLGLFSTIKVAQNYGFGLFAKQSQPAEPRAKCHFPDEYYCYNGGTCVFATKDKFACSCPDGFRGKSCQIAENKSYDPCSSHTLSLPSICRNGGTCIPVQPDNFVCICTEGYSGKHCTIKKRNQCEGRQPCRNGGTCIRKGVDSYACICQPGYYGPKCENDINSYWDPTCQYTEQCGNGGTCIAIGLRDFICACKPGFQGRRCLSRTSISTTYNTCSNHNWCRNGGTCVPIPPANYVCACTAGFYGRNCEETEIPVAATTQVRTTTTERMIECWVNHCKNGGTCRMNREMEISCDCSRGYYGSFCQNADLTQTTEIPEISSEHTEYDYKNCWVNNCLNGGTCRYSVYDYKQFCVCRTGYSGNYCQYVNTTTIATATTTSSPSKQCRYNSCYNGGTCTYKIHDYSFWHTCTCQPGYYGTRCQYDNMITTDSPQTSSATIYRKCSHNTCYNGGTCTYKIQDYSFWHTCTCQSGYFGTRCQYQYAKWQEENHEETTVENEYTRTSEMDLTRWEWEDDVNREKENRDLNYVATTVENDYETSETSPVKWWEVDVNNYY